MEKERTAIVPEHLFSALFVECRKSKNRMLAPLVTLMLNTGMRPEEAVLLRWHQVHIDQQIIDLTKTKTDPRRVPLSASSISVLMDIKRDGLLFVDEETATKSHPVNFFRRSFAEACIRSGINVRKKRDGGAENSDQKNVTLYSLRHSAATYLLASGVDLETVRDILGHKTILQTSKYIHMTDTHKINAVNRQLPWNK